MKKILATLILFVLISSTNIAPGQNAKSEKQKKQEAKIKELIVDQTGVNPDSVSYSNFGPSAGKHIKLGPEHHLTDDLGFDSLDTVEFFIEIEEVFDIDLDEYFKKDRYPWPDSSLMTLGGIFKVVTKKVAEKEKAAEKDAK